MTERARCPICGIPTVPDHATLAEDEAICERCYREFSRDEGAVPSVEGD